MLHILIFSWEFVALATTSPSEEVPGGWDKAMCSALDGLGVGGASK